MAKSTEARLDELEASIENILITLADISPKVARLLLLVDGDDRRDVKGLRNRVAELEKLTEDIIDERNKVKWVLIGMILTSVTNLGTGGALLFKLITGG